MPSSPDGSALDLLIKFHESEPVIANICIVIVVITPITWKILNFLNKKQENQIKNHSNIMNFELKMSEIDSKKEIKAND